MEAATAEQAQEQTPWEITIDLSEWIGRFISVETFDGVMREGRCTDIEWQVFEVNGDEHGIPKALQLNGDPLDTISFHQIRRLRLQ